jgi:hypothetical protein
MINRAFQFMNLFNLFSSKLLLSILYTLFIAIFQNFSFLDNTPLSHTQRHTCAHARTYMVNDCLRQV